MGAKTHRYTAWRLNRTENGRHQGFLARLSEKERDFFDKFEAEYVRGEFKGDEHVHPPELRKQCHNAVCDARYDLFNAESYKVADFQFKPLKKKANVNRYYKASDYSWSSESPEDALLDAIDEANSKR